MFTGLNLSNAAVSQDPHQPAGAPPCSTRNDKNYFLSVSPRSLCFNLIDFQLIHCGMIRYGSQIRSTPTDYKSLSPIQSLAWCDADTPAVQRWKSRFFIEERKSRENAKQWGRTRSSSAVFSRMPSSVCRHDLLINPEYVLLEYFYVTYLRASQVSPAPICVQHALISIVQGYKWLKLGPEGSE